MMQNTYRFEVVISKSGGGMMIARRAAKNVQSIVPNQREWLSILVCVNVAGQSIPSFYIFKGKRFRTIISNSVRREQQWQCNHAHG